MENNSEQIIAKAIELKEAGKSEAEIFDLFPADRAEIAEMFDAINVLNVEKEKIIAPKNILTGVLERLDESCAVSGVTENFESRLTSRGEEKGRPSSILKLINQFNYHMSNAWKTIIPIGVVALILVVFGVYQYGGRPVVNNIPAPEKGQALRTGSAEIASMDDIESDINSIIDSLTDEQSLLAEEETDLALVGSDSQALIAFDSLNEVYGQ